MNSSRLSTTLPSPANGAKTPFELLVAYEDLPTRHRALHLSHHLSREFAADYEFRCSWWKFDHLANGVLREQATHAAAEANMIVLAVNARSTLSPLQSEWIQSWLPLRRSKRARAVNGALVALVALMTNSAPDVRSDAASDLTSDAEQTTEHLRQMAAAARLDFFAHAFELPVLPANSTESPEPDSGLVAPPGLITPPGLVSPSGGDPLTETRLQFKMPIPRWGINE